MFQLHHIGYLVNDMAASAATFAARFGYVIESDIIEDPRQTAKVQFLRQAGAMLWLELVTPTGPGSKLYNTLAKGEGLHHLCYEVPSLEVAGQQLREQYMLPLGKTQPATAFPGRSIAWYMDRGSQLIELLEAGVGPLSLASLTSAERK
ncbi:MAG TPA: VOC family protein [Pirellulales bacterium]